MKTATYLAAGAVLLLSATGAGAEMRFGIMNEAYPPFFTKDAAGKRVGWEIELMDAVAVVSGSAGDRWARHELAPGGTAIERLIRPGRALDRLRRGRVDAVLADESSARSVGDDAIIASTVDAGDYRVFAVSRKAPPAAV